MAPKAKGKAKPEAKGKAKAAAKAASPPPLPGPEKISVFDAETNLNFIDDEDWAALAVEDLTVASVLDAVLLLFGEEPSATLRSQLPTPQLAAELQTLSAYGASGAQLRAAVERLEDVGRLLGPKAPAGAKAAVALVQLVEAYAARGAAPKVAMEWLQVPFKQLHRHVQQALHAQQHVCLVCTAEGPRLYSEALGCETYDLAEALVKIQLSKSMSLDTARGELRAAMKTAMAQGRKFLLLLGRAPPNLRHFCDALLLDAFDFEKCSQVAEALGVSLSPGFQLLLLVESTQARAEPLLPQLLPCIDDMAVMVVENASVESPAAPGLRGALRLLAQGKAQTAAEEPPAVNLRDFEYLEEFGPDWEERWQMGPAETDENGKEIKRGLINAKLVKYPSNPKDAKNCMQLMGGANNAPCTGIWTSFHPPIRPTEVEFEFTVNGKVDLPNACVVFTERAFEGALPDCKVGVQFTVRGGMQLCGGGGNLVRISNDGKIQNDKWNKVLLKIDWADKVTVAQVDTRGKGYAPAIQTVPFRDPSCLGFGALFIYNTDTQATCWFSSLRVKQSQADMVLADTEALAARKDLADRLKQREYQMAVDADMEVGMKMGAIKSTTCHGMNLAMEQAANNAGGSIG